MSTWNGVRWPRVCGVPVLMTAMCAAVPMALAQNTDPYQEEWSDVFEEDRTRPPDDAETVPGGSPPREADEEKPDEEPESDLREEEPRHKTGAEARRELLFREGLDERKVQYPNGLEPAPPVARSDQEVYDARYRGRDAQVLRQTPPGTSIYGGLGAGMFVDSNPQLLTDEQAAGLDTGAWGWFVEPSVAVVRRTPSTLFQGVLRLPYDQFYSFEGDLNDDLGAFNQYLGMQYDVIGRENAFNLFTNVSHSTRRTAIVVETGEELSGDRVLTYGGGGSFKHTLTPDTVVQLSASARRQDLEGNDDDIILEQDNRLEDSSFYQLALDFRKLITRTDAAGIGASYEKFVPDGSFDPDVRIITALANWSRNVSSSMSFLVEGGAQIVTTEEIEAVAPSETSINPYIQTSLYWAATLRDRFLFAYGYSARPTAAGEVRVDNKVEIQYQRELTRTLALGVPLLVLFQSESFTDDFSSRTFVEFEPNLVWAFHPSWTLSLQYQFRLNNGNQFGAATSNAAFLSLNYAGRLAP